MHNAYIIKRAEAVGGTAPGVVTMSGKGMLPHFDSIVGGGEETEGGAGEELRLILPLHTNNQQAPDGTYKSAKGPGESTSQLNFGDYHAAPLFGDLVACFPRHLLDERGRLGKHQGASEYSTILSLCPWPPGQIIVIV